MRKILSEEEIAKKQKRRNIALSIFLLLILFGSTIGFAFLYKSENTTGTQGNSNVQNIGDKWFAYIGNQQFVFSNSPESSLNSTRANIIPDINQYSGKPLYIDTESEFIYAEIASTLGRFSERVQYGCYSSCENSSYPEKTCSDNLIVVRQKDMNRVYQNNSCVFVDGDMRAVDAFLYKIMGLS